MFLRESCHHLSRVFSFVQLSQCQYLIPKCGYARGRGGRDTRQLLLSHKLSKIPDESQLGDEDGHESLFIDPDDDGSRSFDDFYNVLGDRGPTVSHLKKFAKKERERLKLKILKRKYFKDSKEENLLTWETKEQIRFLHQEFPEDWTIEKLSQSFPISHNGIIKLLNSSFVIKTREKILEHDMKVKKKWKELEADLSRKAGPINTQSKNLIESGKLHLMKNAATLKGVPRKMLQLKDDRKTGSEQVGIFSSIVKSYANSKTQNEIITQTNPLDLKQLVEVINSIQQNNINPVVGNASKRASAKSKGSSPVDNSLFTNESHKLPQNTRRRLKKSEEISIDDLSYLEAYQVMGTGKILNSKKKDNKIGENVFTERETRKYFKYSLQPSDSTAPTIQNLSKTRQDSSFQTKIKIPDDSKHKKEVIYKKDDTYYDDQGDILFRLPVNK